MNAPVHPLVITPCSLIVSRSGERLAELPLSTEPVMAGTAKHCAIRLRGMLLAPEQLRVSLGPEGAQLQVLGGFTKTWLNGLHVPAGQVQPLKAADLIQLGDYAIALNVAQPTSAADTPRAHAPAPLPAIDKPAIAAPGCNVSRGLGGQRDGNGAPVSTSKSSYPERTPDPQSLSLRRQVHEQLQDIIDKRRIDVTPMSREQRRKTIEPVIAEILSNHTTLSQDIERTVLTQEVLDEAIGYGPLEPLLDDDTVDEIMVNAPGVMFVERGGVLMRHEGAFSSERALRNTIDRIAASVGRHIDESSPMLDARLPGGHRINAIIPPVAIDGAKVTIRKFPKHRMDMADLYRAGTVSREMAAYLDACVRAKKNILVSGGTGAGKTTLLNVLSNSIPVGERVVTIEDAAELRLFRGNLASLEARPANAEGTGKITIHDLLVNSLRMRPDRIVVGECRGEEALDMLQAMNTGHEGSLTTLHANSPRDALARLETLVLQARMSLPSHAIREQIASAIAVVVQIARLASGVRRVTSVAEITGMEGERFTMQEVFSFDRSLKDVSGHSVGRFVSGAVSNFRDELAAYEPILDDSRFNLE